MEKLSLNEQMKIPCHSYANVNIMTTFQNIMSNTDDQYTVTYIHLIISLSYRQVGSSSYYTFLEFKSSLSVLCVKNVGCCFPGYCGYIALLQLYIAELYRALVKILTPTQHSTETQ